MPVVQKAVLTSPQGIVTAVRTPSPKSMSRSRNACATVVMRPALRMRPPRDRFSMLVLSVPRLGRPVDAKSQRQVRRVGQFLLDARRDAVGRHDVETGGRAQHDACLPRRGIARMHGFEHVDFAGDVEVVAALAQACLDHRRRGGRERTRAVQRHGGALQRAIECAGIVERRDAIVTTQFPGEGGDGRFVASGQHRAESAANRFARDQFARVPRGAVDDEPWRRS